MMHTELPADGFLRHRGLILVAAGGAVAEAGLLALVAPAARSVAPQVTAIPSIAAYHDLRWLFAVGQSWLWFVGLVAAVLIARSALDVALLRLAWPRERPAPPLIRSFASCAALTALAWLLLSPAVTLAFGAAVLPFSWPFLAAFPIILGIAAVLSHGGAITAWWRRLPPLRAVLWLLASFAALTGAAAVITRLSPVESLVITAVAGLINARAWYGLAGLAARLHPREPASVPARLLFSVPFAPIAALMVLVLVAGVVRLMFTGTIQLPTASSSSPPSAASSAVPSATPSGAPSAAPSGDPGAVRPPSQAASGAAASAVLVVGGWGSACCAAPSGLRAVLPGVTMRQFSYAGLGPHGRPLPSGPSQDDVPLPVLGDRMAAQVRALHAATGRRVAIVAESEGTLGVYAMFARNAGLPVSAVVLLSPIIGPGQLSYPSGSDGASVSQDALNELNHLVGGMSPYGPSGAQNLLRSVSEFGSRYFADVVGGIGASAHGPIRWLAVVPLADAVTLPACGMPKNAIVVPAFHGGLLGDPSVLPMIRDFLSGRHVTTTGDGQLRTAAELITGAATAWRMPDTRQSCPIRG